ncbi:MAG: DoxX family protein [Lepagella sp.]
MIRLIKRLYIRFTGYSYTNMGRLFLRLFVGLMMLQFAVRQIMHFEEESLLMPCILGMSSEAVQVTMIVIELACSLFIMAGFCTRMMVLPPFVAMAIAEYYLLQNAKQASYMITWDEPGYLPVMFMGIYFFILLVGPGKISVDYFLSLHIIHSEDQSEGELEEV